jgi:Tfp pilus assembly protein PilP
MIFLKNIQTLFFLLVLLIAVSCKSNKGAENPYISQKNKPSRELRKEHLKTSQKAAKREAKFYKQNQTKPPKKR